MSKNIVHRYFKKELKGKKILLKLDPIYWKATELTIPAMGEIEVKLHEFDEQVDANLVADGFTEVNAMEFNLYDSGLLGKPAADN